MAQAQLDLPINVPKPHHEEERRWQDFFGFSTDHKVIGIQYLVTAFFFYLVGGALATAVRTETGYPRSRFCDS